MSPTNAAPAVTPTILVAVGSAIAAPPFFEVQTGRVRGLGTVLVDGQGMTLYLFVPGKRSGRSTCYKLCAEGWPPFVSNWRDQSGRWSRRQGLPPRDYPPEGRDDSDHVQPVAPIWVGDSEPGQATGQGLNNLGGLWYVLSPNGKAITVHP
jgi:predicted lipoprotein with Yx(FWY)xxD motif